MATCDITYRGTFRNPLVYWMCRNRNVFVCSINKTHKTRKPPPVSIRFLDQVRERIRYLHYSLRTEQSYIYWIRWYIRWHGLRHPREMGGKEVEAFLSMLANVRKASPSTHRQALSAPLFLYRAVLDIELPWMTEIGRPVPTKQMPDMELALGFPITDFVNRSPVLHPTPALSVSGAPSTRTKSGVRPSGHSQTNQCPYAATSLRHSCTSARHGYPDRTGAAWA